MRWPHSNIKYSHRRASPPAFCLIRGRDMTLTAGMVLTKSLHSREAGCWEGIPASLLSSWTASLSYSIIICKTGTIDLCLLHRSLWGWNETREKKPLAHSRITTVLGGWKSLYYQDSLFPSILGFTFHFWLVAEIDRTLGRCPGQSTSWKPASWKNVCWKTLALNLWELQNTYISLTKQVISILHVYNRIVWPLGFENTTIHRN